MSTEPKQNVREFYDQIGWQQVAQGETGEWVYQNARYEDLRPVSQEYLHRCHLRVLRHLPREGRFLLDAGSGPLQYPEYLEFSKGHQYRVCADISHVALQEARKKIGEHGMCVVADVANLPFKRGGFDGVVSMHTIHHLPLAEHAKAYAGLYRVLAPKRTAVIVQGWNQAPLMRWTNAVLKLKKQAWLFGRRLLGKKSAPSQKARQPTGTFVEKHDAPWFARNIAPHYPAKIWVWRSVNVRFLRFVVSERWGGRLLLRCIFRIEERFPHFMGKIGAYPMIVFAKP